MEEEQVSVDDEGLRVLADEDSDEGSASDNDAGDLMFSLILLV